MLAIFPGTFDPITKAHANILVKSIKIFDNIIFAIANSPHKKTYFSSQQRFNLCQTFINSLPDKQQKKISLINFDSLLIELAINHKSNIIIRGIRTNSDFEYELQMALSNRTMYKELETIFITTDENINFISSTLVREVMLYNNEQLNKFIPNSIIPKIIEYIKQKPK